MSNKEWRTEADTRAKKATVHVLRGMVRSRLCENVF
jgi:hypothetical protein